MAKKTKNRICGLITGLAIVMSAALFAACSSFPTLSAKSVDVIYNVLGYIGGEDAFSSYDEAFTAAQKAYPEAQAVIIINGKANNSLISRKKVFGFYAVKFEQSNNKK